MEMKQYEYQMLREEIMEDMKQQESITTFSFTITVSLLAIFLGNKDITPFLCVIPLLFLIVSATKVRQLKYKIINRSAYLMVWHETKDGIYWETNLYKYRKKYGRRRSHIFEIIKCEEFTVCSVACIILYIKGTYFQNENVQDTTQFTLMNIVLLLSILAFIYIIYISFDYRRYDADTIEYYMNKWKAVISESEKKQLKK